MSAGRASAIALSAVSMLACASSFLSQPRPVPSLDGTTASSERGSVRARFAWSVSTGLRVLEVPAGGARDGGLRVGDFVTGIDGESIIGRGERDVVERLRGEVGTPVRLRLARDGAAHEIVVERSPFVRSATED